MKMTALERSEADTTIGYWTINRYYPGGSGEYSYTGRDFSGGMSGSGGAVIYASRAEAEAALPAAQQIANTLYPDDIGRSIGVERTVDFAASDKATARKLHSLRSTARRAAIAVQDRVRDAVQEDHSGLRHYLLPLPETDTLDAWRAYPARAVAYAASRISEAYGLGLGTEWAARHFDMPGDETAALAGHVGIKKARHMLGSR